MKSKVFWIHSHIMNNKNLLRHTASFQDHTTHERNLDISFQKKKDERLPIRYFIFFKLPMNLPVMTSSVQNHVLFKQDATVIRIEEKPKH